MLLGKEQKVRVLRIVMFEGEESWVRQQVERSIKGTKVPDSRKPWNKIHCATIGDFPEILVEAMTGKEEEVE